MNHCFDKKGGYNGKLRGICGNDLTLRKNTDPSYIPTPFEALAVDISKFNAKEKDLLLEYLKEQDKIEKPDFEGDLTVPGLWHTSNALNGNSLAVSFLHKLSEVELHHIIMSLN